MKEGYLQIKIGELQDKVDMLNQNIDEKISKMESIEKNIDNRLQGKLKLIIESEGKLDDFSKSIIEDFRGILSNKLDRLDKILASKIRQALLFNFNKSIELLQNNINESEKINKEFSEDIYTNIRILFTQLYGLCEKLNIKTNDIPDINNKYIRKATIEDITSIIEEELDRLGLKGGDIIEEELDRLGLKGGD